jgi:peptidoglycan/LPS O-acetylase OafA/YrhL
MNVIHLLKNFRGYVTGPGFLRLMLALIVVFHHNTRYIKIGEFAVFAFFMLSGYWIHKMYKEKYALLERPFFSFIISRWLRIYPTYLFNFLLALLLVFVFKMWPDGLAAYETADKTQFWFSSLFLITYNQLPVPLMLLVPAWSLDIELQFYFLFPVLFLFFVWFKPKWVYVVLFALVVLNSTLLDGVFHGTVINAIQFFLVGSILYVTDYTPGKKMIHASWILFFVLLSINYIHPVLRENMYSSTRELMWLGMNYHGLFNMALAVIIIPLLAINVKQPSPPTDRLLGNLSYDIYLFHWVLSIPYNFYFAELPFVQRLPFFFIYLILTILGSLLILKYIDEPVERLRRRWIKETKKTVSYNLQGEPR